MRPSMEVLDHLLAYMGIGLLALFLRSACMGWGWRGENAGSTAILFLVAGVIGYTISNFG